MAADALASEEASFVEPMVPLIGGAEAEAGDGAEVSSMRLSAWGETAAIARASAGRAASSAGLYCSGGGDGDAMS